MTISTIPLGLRHALESGECVLFIGAGIGGHLLKEDGTSAPDAPALANELNISYGLGTASEDLSKVAQLVENRKGKQELENYIRKRFANLTPDKHVQWLATKRWRAIFTTNYDSGLERAYELQAAPPQQPITIANTSELVSFDPRFEVPIWHIHGALFGNRGQIVITKNDYARFRERRRMLFEMLKSQFATSTILYIGYRNADPNWDLVLDEISAEFYPSALPTSYRVAPTTDPTDAELLLSKSIETIDCTFAEFVEIASTELKSSTVDPDRLKRLQATIPTDLVDAFEKNAAATARLVSSWEYVNQAAFNDPPNTGAFLHGDRANWALIGQRLHFARDIEEEIYDDILDYVTGSPRGPSCLFVLAPAGYGTSTVLMSVAVRLVRERVGPILFLRPTSEVIEGDIEYACSLSTSNVTCFLVDNAADVASGLQKAVSHMRNLGKPALFLCGERLNEWRQRKARLSGKEYPIEVLSDREIGLLLDCLARHHQLNKLEPLSRDLQIAVIKKKLSQELLVTMREATEDKRFDVILEDEYHGIAIDVSRDIYLAVCCFYQHGSYMRDTLVAEVAGIPFAELHQQDKASLAGVVIYECVDEASAQYAARARHRKVAQVVWERCGNPNDRERLLQLCIEKMNLTYKTDVAAFEKLVRNDWLIDSIRSLEAKTKFFDTACRKEPSSPYVRQHYARMLSRAARNDLALGQIDQALEIDPKSPPRVLFHTRGVILGRIAMELPSIDVARRRLAQAEDAFRRSLTASPKDDYSYHSLASLYLEWAKKGISEEESTLYIAKAEQVITDGLKQVRVRDSLWIVSSEIDKWLGDQPSRLKALETAVRESPGNVVARYLLGRAYRRQGRQADSMSTLEPVIKGHPDEFRCFIEYALAMWESGRPKQECVAVLRISNIYGLSDTRYIAILGGMLFLDGQFSEADTVFAESQKRDLGYDESNTIHFRPLDPVLNQPLKMNGKIVVVRPTYSLIEVEGYPSFFCHSSKYRGLVFRVGMWISFEVSFSARGAVALSPALAARTSVGTGVK